MHQRFLRSLLTNRLPRCAGPPSGTEPQDPNLFFRHTAGRWLDDEALQQQKRYLAFDIEGLKAAAVAAVEGAKSVTQITKLQEGSYSKAFSLMLDNGKEVIARLPTPHAGPAHLVTASEVATMEFARKRLGIPVPQVFSWSCERTSTAVGAEFIIMERAAGIEVGKVWPQLSPKRRLQFIDAITKIEKAALEYPLPCYGSIFFRSDIKAEMTSVAVDETFAIGPSLHLSFWEDERATLDIDRGPWKTPAEYLSAICRREQQWIRSYGSSEALHPFSHHPAVTRDPSAHIAVLDLFNSVIPHIIPRGPPKITQPTLWHHDLNGGNIFISESELAQGRISITSVIDWQNTTVRPLYIQARVPQVFDYPAPWKLPPGLETSPEPVEEGMSKSDIKAAWQDHFATNRVIFYRAIARRDTPYYYHALTDPNTVLFATLTTCASNIWGGMFHILRTKLLRLQYLWPSISSAPCPIQIKEEEIRTWRLEAQQWQDRTDEMAEIYQHIGMSTEGWTPAEDFKATYRRYKKVKREWIKSGRAEEDWPFTGPAEDAEPSAVRRFFRSILV
ncbi:phosphotransferase family protein [Lyophyllum atratum]|nr:phosphotransferase family protein [Lyophyllum atratum]